MAHRSKIIAFAAVLATGVVLVLGAGSSQAKDNHGTASVGSVQAHVLSDTGDIGTADETDRRDQPGLDFGDIGTAPEADRPDHDGGDVGVVQEADGRDSLGSGDVGTAPGGRD